jgi:beta-N-acetylhexosaminidase
MSVRPGIEVFLEKQVDLVAGKRVGLVANPTSVDAALNSSVERLWQHNGVRLAALFGPEHGIRGSAQAGDQVATAVDTITGLPAYSLYGDAKKPTPDMLDGLDVLVYDLQDGGARFFTYLSTLIYILEAGAENGLPIIVLDRPNPVSGRIPEGGMLDFAYKSFVGMAPVPMRHAMTAGELALMCNAVLKIGAQVTVVRMEGWRRGMWFDETGLPFISPSPNLPMLSSLTVYPGMCLVEGSTLSEGRGTTRPFEYIGAPWVKDADGLAKALNALDLPGARFRPTYFIPSFSKHQGELCAGVQVHVLDRARFRAVPTALHLLAQVKARYPEQFTWRAPWSDGGQRPIDLLAGGNRVREHLDVGRSVSELIDSFEADLSAYEQQRAPHLLYTD